MSLWLRACHFHYKWHGAKDSAANGEREKGNGKVWRAGETEQGLDLRDCEQKQNSGLISEVDLENSLAVCTFVGLLRKWSKWGLMTNTLQCDRTAACTSDLQDLDLKHLKHLFPGFLSYSGQSVLTGAGWDTATFLRDKSIFFNFILPFFPLVLIQNCTISGLCKWIRPPHKQAECGVPTSNVWSMAETARVNGFDACVYWGKVLE